eukprot:4967981-Amphidinium_carterae.1
MGPDVHEYVCAFTHDLRHSRQNVVGYTGRCQLQVEVHNKSPWKDSIQHVTAKSNMKPRRDLVDLWCLNANTWNSAKEYLTHHDALAHADAKPAVVARLTLPKLLPR